MATDIGLWVGHHTDMGGMLDLAGAVRTPWLRLAAGATAGATSITLASSPTGWQIGDAIVIAPTEVPSVGDRSWEGFEGRTITAVAGATITLNAALAHAHPVNTFQSVTYTAEVFNLTRNVIIEGTGDGSALPENNGRSHVMCMGTDAQTLKYVLLRHLGPRVLTEVEPPTTDFVRGRYPLHFHLMADGSRGSLVEGVVVHTCSRGFVPHGSHGITFQDTIAYDIWEDGYWWDPSENQDPNDPDLTQDLLYHRSLAAKIKPHFAGRGFGMSGFKLEGGTNLECRDCVSVGIQGTQTASGFHWPSSANQRPNVWIFNTANVSHNNRTNGAYIWQNDKNQHFIDNFISYNNGQFGVDHGAYINDYNWEDLRLFGNASADWAQHNGNHLIGGPQFDPLRDDGYTFGLERVLCSGALRFMRHLGLFNQPALYFECEFSGIEIADAPTPNSVNVTKADFVNCTKVGGGNLTTADVTIESAVPGMQVRFQYPDDTAELINHTGAVTSIQPFYGEAAGALFARRGQRKRIASAMTGAVVGAVRP